MSLKDIRSECSDVAGLLQPYVDGELNDQEQEQVAAHLEDCAGCRTAVSEQAWVRATLQAVQRDPAPHALRAKILLGLDEVDRERAAEAAASAPPGLGARLWARMRELGRGGLIMVPAGAVAIALFFMAREGIVTPDGTEMTASPGVGVAGAIVPGAEASHGSVDDDDDDVMRAIAELEPQVGIRVQVPQKASHELQLVGARLHHAGDDQPPAAHLRYRLPDGQLVIDRQRPATASFRVAGGTALAYSGRSYDLHRDAVGRPVLSFELGGVAHSLVLEGGATLPHAPHAADPDEPDYAPLLRFAARLDGG
ncbi:anti-sigma factor family protein [Paraliomyxa miuraensis]|uniref:anti-sigma factor family protein n=1 Tax=Paraliomyxa miuraensis TaxID=376150 RepID=UPI00225A143C|nr:zf-HC2 domain-containing protein [Paraliomyxa miuraensis]MCX4245439.1 anti-sigma factor [Paraliomyxa miuraensis]